MNRVISRLRRLTGGKRAFAVFVLLAATAISLSAQIFTTLHNFHGTDGQNPNGGLVQTINGDLYGVTLGGGASNCSGGCGTVFKITPRGTLTILHSFNFADGYEPNTLIQATDGDLYGTTLFGGITGSGSTGAGTIFKIALDGTLTMLHTFNSFDGALPDSLIQAADGNFYGTTYKGAAAFGTCPVDLTGGCGTVFKMSPQGTLTTLHYFCSQANCTDGLWPAFPTGFLIQGVDGDFYGTTWSGGANQICQFGALTAGCGTIFKITPKGVLTTLYSFCSQANCTDGWLPGAGLTPATNGDLYGTTADGGASNSCIGGRGGCGTVFKITPTGALTTLHSFDNAEDGGSPNLALIQADDGSFYGTTLSGGVNNSCSSSSGCGTIFRITANGALTTVYNFASYGGQLVEVRNGNFYGTTVSGGTNNDGTIFSLEVFVKTLPTSGAVGSGVKIRGTNLTGATSVTFNGVAAAAFQVVSADEITTTVPPGASTGEVKVVLPGGTLWSVRPFRVP